jgi:glycerol-3-phosphate acyltransferase PlsY
MSIAFFLLAIGAYLIGSIPMAYLIVKWKRGIDIRHYGSGNVGAANALKQTSKRWATIVMIFDISKGAVMVWIAQLLDISTGLQMVIGLLAIAGHNWPIFLGFQGGRGIFTSLGVIVAISPLLGLIVLVMAYSLAPFKQLPLGVFIALTALPLLSYFLAESMGIVDHVPVTIGFVILTIIALGRRLFGHRSLISQGISNYELLINRLLFDRDIRNREAWINRSEAS